MTQEGSWVRFYVHGVGLANGTKPHVTCLKAQHCQHSGGGQVMNMSASQCMIHNYVQSLIYTESNIYKGKFLCLKLEK